MGLRFDIDDALSRGLSGSSAAKLRARRAASLAARVYMFESTRTDRPKFVLRLNLRSSVDQTTGNAVARAKIHIQSQPVSRPIAPHPQAAR